MTLFERFDKRVDANVAAPKTLKKEDYNIEMSLKEFCDKFNSTVKKGKTPEEQTLNLRSRIDQTETKFYPL